MKYQDQVLCRIGDGFHNKCHQIKGVDGDHDVCLSFHGYFLTPTPTRVGGIDIFNPQLYYTEQEERITFIKGTGCKYNQNVKLHSWESIVIEEALIAKKKDSGEVESAEASPSQAPRGELEIFLSELKKIIFTAILNYHLLYITKIN